MEMVFVGPAGMDASRELSIDEVLAQELLTFQRGSQPHVALLDALSQAGVTDKRVHTISSISELVKLIESGFGLATLPRAAAAELTRHHRIVLLRSALKLAPLPLYANYWSNPAAPALEEAIAHALEFTRRAASEDIAGDT